MFNTWKIWAALAAAAALTGFATYYTLHEQHVGELKQLAKDRADDKKAADDRHTEDAKKLKGATDDLATLRTLLDESLQPIAPPHTRVAIRVFAARPADQSGTVREDARACAGSDGGVRSGDGLQQPGAGVDLTPAIEAALNAAGARIRYLQGYILSCQNRGFCAKEGDANASP